MSMFNFIEDLEEWLEPMDYETFWTEIKAFCLILIPKEKCDTDIEIGEVTEEDALKVLKMLARVELTKILKLEHSGDIFPVESKALH